MKILILIGENVEDYDIIVPKLSLQMVGYQVDTISHGKQEGEFVSA
jgi:putative intracellular protease/amidase